MPDEAALEELLSRPTPALVAALGALDGDLLILGAGGKMGPSLARLALRASAEAGVRRRVIAAARFSEPGLAAALREQGVEIIAGDLCERELLARLPDAPNVVYMVGQKFGTTGEEARTWAVNACLPGLVAERFPRSRIVAFSTGNVYPLARIGSDGPVETDPVGPVGEYAQSALARERVLEFFSRRNGTPMAILRPNNPAQRGDGVGGRTRARGGRGGWCWCFSPGPRGPPWPSPGSTPPSSRGRGCCATSRTGCGPAER